MRFPLWKAMADIKSSFEQIYFSVSFEDRIKKIILRSLHLMYSRRKTALKTFFLNADMAGKNLLYHDIFLN